MSAQWWQRYDGFPVGHTPLVSTARFLVIGCDGAPRQRDDCGFTAWSLLDQETALASTLAQKNVCWPCTARLRSTCRTPACRGSNPLSEEFRWTSHGRINARHYLAPPRPPKWSWTRRLCTGLERCTCQTLWNVVWIDTGDRRRLTDNIHHSFTWCNGLMLVIAYWELQIPQCRLSLVNHSKAQGQRYLTEIKSHAVFSVAESKKQRRMPYAILWGRWKGDQPVYHTGLQTNLCHHPGRRNRNGPPRAQPRSPDALGRLPAQHREQTGTVLAFDNIRKTHSSPGRLLQTMLGRERCISYPYGWWNSATGPSLEILLDVRLDVGLATLNCLSLF